MLTSYLSENLCREIIIDHISNPRNINKNHDNYLSQTLKNPSCGDVVTVYVDKDNDYIKDITYDVSGCSICKSSASIMSEILVDKKVEETLRVIDNFNKMVIGKEYDEGVLKDAASLRGISNVPPRIKCATLGYKAFLEAIGEKDES